MILNLMTIKWKHKFIVINVYQLTTRRQTRYENNPVLQSCPGRLNTCITHSVDMFLN